MILTIPANTKFESFTTADTTKTYLRWLHKVTTTPTVMKDNVGNVIAGTFKNEYVSGTVSFNLNTDDSCDDNLGGAYGLLLGAN
jgi:hypothetical protein